MLPHLLIKGLSFVLNYLLRDFSKDALLILIESYNNLESYNLALDNAKVLVTNYSNYSYKVNQNGKVLIHDKNVKEEEKIESSFFDLGLF